MEELRELLRALDGTQEDIERIAGRAIALEAAGGDVRRFVEVWLETVRNNSNDALVYMYVANDIVQKCRGSKLWAAFKAKLPDAIEKIKDDAENRPKFVRMLSIWARRKVFDKGTVMALRKQLSQASLDTEFGELPEFQSRDDPFNDAYARDSDDGDDENEKGDQGDEDNDEDGLRGPFKRESAISIIQRAPVSRLLSAAKRSGEEAQELANSVLDLAKDSTAALRRRAGDGDPASEASRLQTALEALPDSVLFDIQDTTLTALQKLVASRGAVRRAAILASAVVMNVEAQMESVSKVMNDAETQIETISRIEDRVGQLEKDQKGKNDTGKIEATVVTLRRNLKATARKKRVRATSDEVVSSDESGSEYEDVEDDEGEDNDGQGADDADGDGAAKDAKMSRLGIRKRKRRKKKKVKEKVEEDVPMIWNKQLNMYVAMPSNQEEEDWRN